MEIGNDDQVFGRDLESNEWVRDRKEESGMAAGRTGQAWSVTNGLQKLAGIEDGPGTGSWGQDGAKQEGRQEEGY